MRLRRRSDDPSAASSRVSANVRRAVYVAGWTLEDVAALTGIHLATLVSHFDGRSPWTHAEIEAVAVALGVSAVALAE